MNQPSNDSLNASRLPESFAQFALHSLRGFLMGAADVIPGVSGGTIALVLGVYERLVTAISRFDVQALVLLKRRDLRGLAAHVDLGFLAALMLGIALGIGGLANLMHYLLEHHLQPTNAAFFGLILGSSWLVSRLVRRWTTGTMALAAIGAALAFVLVGTPALTNPPPGNTYVFFCGMVAICAMILPGISGSFILVLLGRYKPILDRVKWVLEGQVTIEYLGTLGAFGLGCVVGLLAFSKFLRWLLAHYHDPTMAVLCGFMVGSLRKIWPFKDSTEHNIWPDALDGDVALAVGICIAAAAFVLALDWVSSRKSPRGESPQA